MSLAQITNDYANKNITIRAERGIFNTMNINDFETGKIIITSASGITSSGVVLNIITNETININSGDTINLISNNINLNSDNIINISSSSNININSGDVITLSPTNYVNIQAPLLLDNQYTTISTSSVLNGYSNGGTSIFLSPSNDFCALTTPALIIISYSRIGDLINITFPETTLSLLTGGANSYGTFITTAIPAELRPTTTKVVSAGYCIYLGSTYGNMTANIATTGVITFGDIQYNARFPKAMLDQTFDLSSVSFTYSI